MDTVSASPASSSPTLTSLASAGFDLGAFRCDQRFSATAQAKPELNIVLTEKPKKQAWIYHFPGDQYRLTAAVFEREVDRKLYLLDQATAMTIDPELVKLVCLCLYVTRDGVLGFWPVPMPRADGRTSLWQETAQDIAFTYAGQWINVRASMVHGGYQVTKSPLAIDAPELPTLPLNQLIALAFKGRMITDANHVVLRQLRGEA